MFIPQISFTKNWTTVWSVWWNWWAADCKKETGNKLATRARFKDSVDFIGWYTNKSENILKISKKDAFKQYLAYHEGWGNYKNYKKNKKVIGLAKKVERQSNKYKNQLLKCKSKLNRKKYIIF